MKAKGTLGFYDAEIVDGIFVPIIPNHEALGIVSPKEYLTLRARWAELSEEDQAKVTRFEAFLTGVKPRKGKRKAEPDEEDEEPTETAQKAQGELF